MPIIPNSGFLTIQESYGNPQGKTDSDCSSPSRMNPNREEERTSVFRAQQTASLELGQARVANLFAHRLLRLIQILPEIPLDAVPIDGLSFLLRTLRALSVIK